MLKSGKKLICVFVMLIALFIFAGIAYAEGNMVGTVTADVLNVRETPGTSAKILAKVLQNTEVKVTETKDGWHRIVYNEITGWVCGDYLTVREEAIGEGIIGGSNVNVRNNPDLSSEVIIRLQKNDKVAVFNRKGDWYRIQLAGGQYGWVYKDLISVKLKEVSRGAEESTAPVVEAPQANEEPAQQEETSTGQKVVEYAKKLLGIKYVYGGSSPKKGFDCSGLTSYVYKQFGVNIERTAAGQANHGTKIEKSALRAGDLVFFTSPRSGKSIGHVGIYISDGKFIHASSGSQYKVIISDLTSGSYAKRYVTARRYFNNN